MSHISNYPHIRRKELPASYKYFQPPHKSDERVEFLSESKYQEWSITAKSKPLCNNGRKVFACIVDGICMILCIATFTFAMLVYRANNTMMDSYRWRLLGAAKIGTTAFPYVFALIVGRSLQSVLSWRLGHGVDVLSFAYLSKSSSLASAFITPLKLRSAHWLPLVLASLWILSPFGSQAMLRFVNVQQLSTTSDSPDPVQYFYPAANEEVGGDDQPGVNSANAILQASLLSVGTTIYKPQDPFGNLKIPDLQSLGLSEDSRDWIVLPPSNNFSYLSLVGIPFSKPTGTGNLTFTLQSWYWTLDNPIISQVNTTGMKTTQAFPELPIAGSSWTNHTSIDNFWQFLTPSDRNLTTAPSTSLPLTFEVADTDAQSNNVITSLSANLTHCPVELQVACDSLSCQATAIRNADFPELYDPHWDFKFVIGWFLTYLTEAFPLNHKATIEPTVFEIFLNDSTQDPFNTVAPYESFNLYELGADELALRLKQILNTYWVALSAESSLTGFDAANLTQLGDYNAVANTTFSLNATATFYNWTDFLQCDMPWLIVLCLATIIMFSAAVVSIVFTHLYDGPEATDFISALTRSYHVPVLEHGSYLGGDDLVRQLKDVELKIGDARPENEVGQIVIGPSELLGHLERNRHYA